MSGAETVEKVILAETIILFPDLSLAQNEAIAASAYRHLVRSGNGIGEKIAAVQVQADCDAFLDAIMQSIGAAARLVARDGWDKIGKGKS